MEHRDRREYDRFRNRELSLRKTETRSADLRKKYKKYVCTRVDNPAVTRPKIRNVGQRSLIWETIMLSPIVKRSIVISGHKTSVSLEDAFWLALKEIAIADNITISTLASDIDSRRERGNLSSAIRLFVLGHFRAPAKVALADRAGDGMAPGAMQNGRDAF